MSVNLEKIKEEVISEIWEKHFDNLPPEYLELYDSLIYICCEINKRFLEKYQEEAS